MEIKIRPFTMSDFEGVRQLWDICHIQLGPQDTIEEIQKKLKRDGNIFLVAEANNIIMGTVMGAWDGRNGWIYNHAVDARSRRLGLGSKLMVELERRLKEIGAIQTCLLVSKGNFDAQFFYEANGFVSQEDEIVMVKKLKARKEEGKSV